MWRAPAQIGISDLTFVHLEIDQANPNRVFGVTWNHLYLTDDDGESWTALAGYAFPRRQPETRVTDRGRPFAQMVRGGTRFVLYAPPCGGVCWADGALEFECFDIVADQQPDNCAAFIAADPVTGYVWVSTLAPQPRSEFEGSAHVYRTSNAWEPGAPSLQFDPAFEGLPEGDHVVSLVAVTPEGAAAPRVLAFDWRNIGASGDPDVVTRTYRSSDGLTWEPAAVRMDGCDLTEGGTYQGEPRASLYAGAGDDVFFGNACVHASPDAGESWHAAPNDALDPPPYVDFRGLFLERRFDQQGGVLWGANDGGENTGDRHNVVAWNWPGVFFGTVTGYPPVGLAAWQAYSVATIIRPNGAIAAWLGSHDNGAVCYPDVAHSSASVPARVNVSSGDVFAFAVASDQHSIYARGPKHGRMDARS